MQCGYHGLEFDTGAPAYRCRASPGTTGRRRAVLPGSRTLPLYLDMAGRCAQGRSGPDPRLSWNDDPDWISNTGYFHVEGNHQLLVDNLLDLSHVQFVHATTLGADGVSNAPLDTHREDDKVRIDRWIMDKPPPPCSQAPAISRKCRSLAAHCWTAPTMSSSMRAAPMRVPARGMATGPKASRCTQITRSRPKPRNPATISGTTRATTASTIQTSRNSLQKLPAPPLAKTWISRSAATQHR